MQSKYPDKKRSRLPPLPRLFSCNLTLAPQNPPLSLSKQHTPGLPLPHRLSPFPQTPPTPHYPSPSTNSWLMNALLVLHPCKTLGVQYRASLPVPCQRELACGKARLFQILLLFATHATPKSCKPYLPSRLRDRRPDYLHFTNASANNPSVTVTENSVLFCTSLT